ncbi:acyloxyacyl hydrolase [Pseudooceanicola spongiae]|uniref:Acyloxyacyl hydrolase n=1 Tax=Pseudooceanicola spongiae TaxID=2613965 RepID=A0A7L9WP95_9RHOB|nr:acyloxyacyl hydrolase [Pseudooceanicola spongiae]QOL81664.1 acyloxyacyl hydrolase [Pseudooceanicola spongiae]
MDGTFAVLFLIAGLTDMGVNHCPEQGCLAPESSESRLALSFGDVMYQEDKIDRELYLRFDAPVSYGPFQPAFGASLSGDGTAWIGGGATWTTNFDRAYMQLHLMPGVYARGDGPDLGSTVEFRSGVEIGFEARNGIRYGLSYDHRSNADLSSVNPGLETIQLRVSFPLNIR